uniref:C2H2-type domain-containing protein n=1 Tax=Heterorhabditis bacteriophora TaxID=37862 RepID=A0A1I7WR48_HETBA
MIQLHQCPLCEYGAPESRLVKRHLKNNHMEYIFILNLTLLIFFFEAVLCLLSQFEAEMRETGTQCFPDWVIESSQFEKKLPQFNTLLKKFSESIIFREIRRLGRTGFECSSTANIL